MEQFCISLSMLTLITTYIEETIIPATASMLVMGYADSSAAIIGRKYQIYKRKEYECSFIGTITFIIVAITVLENYFCYINKFNIFIAMVISIISGIVEAKILPQYDNITIPIVVYILLQSACLGERI